MKKHTLIKLLAASLSAVSAVTVVPAAHADTTTVTSDVNGGGTNTNTDTGNDENATLVKTTVSVGVPGVRVGLMSRPNWVPYQAISDAEGKVTLKVKPGVYQVVHLGPHAEIIEDNPAFASFTLTVGDKKISTFKEDVQEGSSKGGPGLLLVGLAAMGIIFGSVYSWWLLLSPDQKVSLGVDL